jgi:large subunit ribosomal protein L18
MNIKKRLEKREKKTSRQYYRLKNLNAYNDRLRINVAVSGKHALAQVISADGTKTLAYVSTQQKWFKDTKAKSYNVGGASKLGEQLGTLLKKDFSNEKFYFDRGGKVYTGRIAAIADGIRNQGIIL